MACCGGDCGGKAIFNLLRSQRKGGMFQLVLDFKRVLDFKGVCNILSPGHGELHPIQLQVVTRGGTFSLHLAALLGELAIAR